MAATALPAQTVFTVTNALDNGPGSLRQAILDANNSPGRDTIQFKIPGAGVHSISLSTALPQISEAVVIDGFTQPGYAGLPLIALNGANAGNGVNGLLLLGGNSVVRGLAINRFKADGIHIEGPGTNIIQGNIIGADATGKFVLGNGQGGITIRQSSGNMIGGTNANEGNLISGSNLSGVYILGPGADNNVVAGNLIGTDITGTLAMANTLNGVVISGGMSNIVGCSNIISGNAQSGVYLLNSGTIATLVQGNRIGTDLTGTQALANGSDGVTVYGASGSIIGGTNAAAGNLISGNGARGVYIGGTGSVSNVVCGNSIGTDQSGRLPLVNAFAGVTILEGLGNQIGGPDASWGNVISGNRQSGVTLSDGAVWNMVEGNFIGVDQTGTNALGNGYYGVNITGSSNKLGVASARARNVISGNHASGVYITGTNAVGNVLEGNLIGTDVTGSMAVSNAYSGVVIEDAPANLVGGLGKGAGNVISGQWAGYGVYVSGLSAAGNVVQGNLIGTDITGEGEVDSVPPGLGGNDVGIGITNAPSNLIGGTIPWARNVVSGNDFHGISLMGPMATNNVLQGNRIGTDASGTKSLSNWNGIDVAGSPNNLIGGTAPGAGNLISGNQNLGISIGDPGASGNLVQGNIIGPQIDGISPLGNGTHNIELRANATGNLIGGIAPGAGNRISYAQMRLYTGVRARGNAKANTIRGNSIFHNGNQDVGLGIDLEPNGPNVGSTPVLTGATGRYVTQVQGTMTGATPNHQYTIDLYLNSVKDPSGYGEGERWLSWLTVTTDNLGNAIFSTKFTNCVAAVGFISATATDPEDGTTEFGPDIPNVVLPSVDSDHDGLPDDYELAWGLNPNDPTDAAKDSNGDGMTNLQKFLAGLNPQNSADALRILSQLTRDGETWLTFPTVAGERYHVEYSDTVPATWIILSTNLAGTGSPIMAVDGQSGGNPARFYRVVCP